MKRISKNTIKRALRTFLQAFLGSFIAAGTNVVWNEVDIFEALIGIIITSVFAGLSALCMNLEKEE